MLSDFNGVSLSGGDVLVNPDLDLAHELRGWWDSEGCRQEMTSLTVSGARGGEGSAGVAKIIGEVKHENLGQGEKGDYYNSVATVTFYRSVTIIGERTFLFNPYTTAFIFHHFLTLSNEPCNCLHALLCSGEYMKDN